MDEQWRVEELDLGERLAEPIDVTSRGRKGLAPISLRDHVAREIMSSPAIACREEALFEEVAELLADREISGFPVVNPDGDVVGVISERDLAHALGGPLIRLVIRRPVHTGPFLRGPRGVAGGARRAEDIMTSPAVVAHPDTPLHTLAEILVEEQINRIPIERDKRLVGVVTRGDVLAAIAGLSHREAELEEPPVVIGSGVRDSQIRNEVRRQDDNDDHLRDRCPHPQGRVSRRGGAHCRARAGRRLHDLADDIVGYEIGDRVLVGAITPCGTCSYCQNGQPAQCGGQEDSWELGGGWRFGNSMHRVQADYFLVPYAQANLTKIPESLRDEQVVYCADIASSGISAIEKGGVVIGDSVAVFAQGPIGLCATAGAKLSGASLVIEVDSIPGRLEMARRMGADVVIDYKQQDPIEEIRRLAVGGRGVDVAVEALGTQQTFESSLRAIRAGGTLSRSTSNGSLSSRASGSWGSSAAGDLLRVLIRSDKQIRSDLQTILDLEVARLGAYRVAVSSGVVTLAGPPRPHEPQGCCARRSDGTRGAGGELCGRRVSDRRASLLRVTATSMSIGGEL